jgi:hypothetical protein
MPRTRVPRDTLAEVTLDFDRLSVTLAVSVIATRCTIGASPCEERAGFRGASVNGRDVLSVTM